MFTRPLVLILLFAQPVAAQPEAGQSVAVESGGTAHVTQSGNVIRDCQAGSDCSDIRTVVQAESPWLKWLVVSAGVASLAGGWVMWRVHRGNVDELDDHDAYQAGYFDRLDAFDSSLGSAVVASTAGGLLLSSAALAWMPEREPGTGTSLLLGGLAVGAAASIGASVGLLLTGPASTADTSIGGRSDRRWAGISLAASHAVTLTSAFAATLARLEAAPDVTVSVGSRGGSLSARVRF